MRISTRLHLAALVPAFIAVVIGLGLYRSYTSVVDLEREQRVASTIGSQLNELNDLARTYVRTHEARPKRQFLLVHRQTIDGIRAAESLSADAPDVVRYMSEDVDRMQTLFLQMVNNYETRDADSSPLLAQSEDRLAGQLFVRSRSAYRAASVLSRQIEDEIVEKQRQIVAQTVAFTVLVAAALTFLLLALANSINRSLTALQSGTEQVGSGNLDYRIGLENKDELGVLASSFDSMTGRLQEVTVSKDELEREVEERRRAEATARDELEARTMLLNAAHLLSEVMDITAVSHGLADMLATTSGRSRVVVMLYDEGRERLEVVAARGEQHLPVGYSAGFDVLAPEYRRALDTGEPQILDYEGAELSENDLHRAQAASAKLAAIFPLVGYDRVRGLLILDEPGRREMFDDRLMNLISGVAAQAGAAVERAQLFESQREAVILGEATSRINMLIHSTLRFSDVAESVLEAAAEALHATTGVLWAEVDDGWEPRYTTADDSAPIEILGVELSSLSRTTDTPPVVEQSGRPGAVAHADMIAVGVASLLAVQLNLTAGGRAILSFRFSEPCVFSRAQVEFVRALASSLSLSIENARLYDREHRVADRLQEALLEMPKQMRGIELAHAYHSAAESARVGGDFYDLFEIDEHLVGITVGDVAGKGLDAAMLTSLVKNTVRAHAVEKATGAARVLELANEVVYRATAPEAFVTVFFGVLDRRDGWLVYANAGHTAAAVVRRGKEPAVLPPTGPMLGAFSGTTYGSSTMCCLEPMETLFLYTDGLIEARADGKFYGEQRLLDLLAKGGPQAPSTTIEAVLDDVLAFAHMELKDDLAILCLRLLEPDVTAPRQERMDV